MRVVAIDHRRGRREHFAKIREVVAGGDPAERGLDLHVQAVLVGRFDQLVRRRVVRRAEVIQIGGFEQPHVLFGEAAGAGPAGQRIDLMVDRPGTA